MRSHVGVIAWMVICISYILQFFVQLGHKIFSDSIYAIVREQGALMAVV